MNRRLFLKALAAVGGGAILPQTFSLSSMYKQANAAINYSAVNITASSVPPILPQIINVFLYGGPSELAGNLSNIADIEANSQSKYTDFFQGILDPQDVATDGLVTPSGFWGSNKSGINNEADRGAGGDDMQFLLDQGHMSVYRTMMKRKNTSQSHRESILMSQKGSLDIDFAPGFGFKLAGLISENRALFEANTTLADGTAIADVEKLVMPFVSISDGDTRIFDKDSSVTVPLLFGGISVDTELDNPFSRNIPNPGADPAAEEAALDAIVQQSVNESGKDYSEVLEAFKLRQELADAMGTFDGAFDTGGAGLNLPTLTDAADIAANGGNTALVYPNTSIGRIMRAAVTLSIENPGTLFTTLGGAFGGWDDHNNGVDRYPQRMRDVFAALRVAMLHIKYLHNAATPINGLTRPTDNIIINVFGDFGRRVNLNTSLGWNHGNNQNFFTLGGARPGLRTAAGVDAMGKVAGTTVRVGDAGADRQFTEPASGSYEFEPMSVASNIYKYFGVIHPAVIDENNPDPLTSSEDPENPGQLLDPGSPPIEEDPTKNGAV
ncbi:MAG: hypothetical protein IMF17_02780 [Proteobacteria bacterium]|nr:hypothetical protein [Pseudomonadota bacterium]